jgi:hypothetical protein
MLTIAIVWYIWRGAIFRVPLSTLQRPKRMGGWGLVDIEAKCRALLLCRMYLQSKREVSATAKWLQSWNLSGQRANPSHAQQIPVKLAYLHIYAIDMAYIMLPMNAETIKSFRQNIQHLAHDDVGGKTDARITDYDTTPRHSMVKSVAKSTCCLDDGGHKVHLVHGH